MRDIDVLYECLLLFARCACRVASTAAHDANALRGDANQQRLGNPF